MGYYVNWTFEFVITPDKVEAAEQAAFASLLKEKRANPEDLAGNPDSVHIGAVVGAQILDVPVVALSAHARVLPRHAHVGNKDLAVRAPADDGWRRF